MGGHRLLKEVETYTRRHAPATKTSSSTRPRGVTVPILSCFGITLCYVSLDRRIAQLEAEAHVVGATVPPPPNAAAVARLAATAAAGGRGGGADALTAGGRGFGR